MLQYVKAMTLVIDGSPYRFQAEMLGDELMVTFLTRNESWASTAHVGLRFAGVSASKTWDDESEQYVVMGFCEIPIPGIAHFA